VLFCGCGSVNKAVVVLPPPPPVRMCVTWPDGVCMCVPPRVLQGKQVLFMTNNSMKSRANYLNKFIQLGVPADVVGPGGLTCTCRLWLWSWLCMASAQQQQQQTGCKCYIGSTVPQQHSQQKMTWSLSCSLRSC
jgi:hypothetical protein